MSDTAYLNTKAAAGNTYDAIVIGSGISGGWAAKELTQKGLKVLLLERGKDHQHIKDYKGLTMIHGIRHIGAELLQSSKKNIL